VVEEVGQLAPVGGGVEVGVGGQAERCGVDRALRGELHQAETGKTITRNVSGPTITTVRPDGTATFVGGGNNRLLFGPTSRLNTGEAPLVFTSGRVVVDYAGNIATGFSLSARQENVCALLAS
jgi:hypothetical protein